MLRYLTAAPAALVCLVLAFPAGAQTSSGQAQTSSSQAPSLNLRDTAFLTCADAQAMTPDQRKALTLQIAEAAANHYQTRIADSEQTGQQIGWLIRSACTMGPETYYSTVVARAVRVMGAVSSRR